MILFVTPHHRDHALRQLLDSGRLFPQFIRPEKHSLAAFIEQAVESRKIFPVDSMAPGFQNPALAAPLSKFPRFITSKMNPIAVKPWQQLLKQAIHEFQGGLVRTQDRTVRLPSCSGMFETVRTFRQVVIVIMPEPAIHVPKGILVWHQFNMAVSAKGLQFLQLGARHW